MSESTVNCPSGFRLYQSRNVRACGRPVTSSGSCVSVEFPSNYLNSYYVDGVSITHGSPRHHVWTLLASGFDELVDAHENCPCATGSAQQVQSFVGDHYFCESGFAGTVEMRQQQLYTSDPLWDGESCHSTEIPCCNVPGIPWFHRDYGNTTTTDYIELRVCGDEETDNEDVPVSFYEIYVQ